MTEAKKLVLKYWSIIAQLPVEFLEASFDTSNWMKDRAIQCAIAETEAVIKAHTKLLDNQLNNDFDVMNERSVYGEILTELKQMQ